MTATDSRLVELERLYRERFAQFVRVAVAITGAYDLAVEAVQDGFADAIRSRRTFRGRRPLEGWVWRAVVNAARDARRAERRSTAPAPAAVNGVPPEAPDLRAAHRSLRRALTKEVET